MKIALVGGGGSAHLLAVILSARGHEVRVLTSRPHLWNEIIELETANAVLRGKIKGAGDDPVQIVDGVDVVFFCMPVHQYPLALERLLPIIARNPNCIVGPVYGQAGFDWMIGFMARKMQLPVPKHFAIGLLPWIVRVQKYGHRAISYGPKFRNGIATSSPEVFYFLNKYLLNDLSMNIWGCGEFYHVPNFLTITLTVDNQIIHPSRCFALLHETSGWRCEEEIPFFYRDWDDFSTEVLMGVDRDYSAIRNALFEGCPRLRNEYSLNYLGLEHWSYGSHTPDIKSSFVQSSTLGYIKPPVRREVDGVFRLDVDHRFFYDDFGFGLEICKWFADELDCKVPTVEKLLLWYRNRVQPFQRRQYCNGVPAEYGLALHDLIK